MMLLGTRHLSIAIGVACSAAVLTAVPARTSATEFCEGYGGLPVRDGPHAGMVRLEGGTFTMGADDERPEERGTREVTVSPFWIDRHEVTNAQFAAFVDATGYRTVAERGLDPDLYRAIPADLRVPGSMVFSPPSDPVSLHDQRAWWRYVPGANWRQPLGEGSSIDGLDNYPVVHIAHEDAMAYADWAGRDLPTEAEWEFAARGGLEGARYTWGETYNPAEGWKANTWQGSFPHENTAADGHAGSAPVGCFAANGYGLYDMAGNVWEYARDYWAPGHPPFAEADPTGPGRVFATRFGSPMGPSVVVKGGSWLCAPGFCLRYRPSARQPQEPGLGSNHIGFRTVLRE